MSADPVSLISQKTRDWWKDDRRNWCAYCGTAVDFGTNQAGKAKGTRDHIIPKAHRGQHVTIPSCSACNVAKGSKSLPEFLTSKHFVASRAASNGHYWPLRDLWLVMAMAAVYQAKMHSEEWPSSKPNKHEASAVPAKPKVGD